MSHKIEDCNQDTVESSHENIHCSQDIDVSAQSKIYGLDVKGGLYLKLGLGNLKVHFIEKAKDLLFKVAGQIWNISKGVNSRGSFVNTEKFCLIRLAVFELQHIFVQGGRKPLLNLNEIDSGSRTVIILEHFANKP